MIAMKLAKTIAGPFATLALVCVAAFAQQPRHYTDQDYANAEKFMAYNVNPLAYKGQVNAQWLDNDRFWYREIDDNVSNYVMVDPAKGSRSPLFNPEELAAALKPLTNGTGVEARHLQLSDISLTDSDHTLTFTMRGATYQCSIGAGKDVCKVLTGGAPAKGQLPQPPMTLSPDKKLGAFIRDWNLWVRDLTTGSETQLTTDGVKDFGYATDNAGWKHSDSAILLWSPDSKKIATFQQDQRKTGEMYLVPVTNTHPELKAWKYPLVGDKDVTMIQRVVIDVNARKVIRLKMPPDQHRSTLCDDIACDGNTLADVEWGPDEKHLAFVSTSREHKQEWVREANAETGEVREVMTEKTPKFYESGNGKINWHYLPQSNELLWFSERDNWGNLYLYDLTTGKLKNPITQGPGNVTQVLYVDDKARIIYFVGVGKEKGRDPYYEHFYSVKFDGTDLKLLTPENSDHHIKVSHDGHLFTDTYSTPTQPQVTVVRDDQGKTVMEVARQDISKLTATGWQPLTPITVKGRDGTTDLYGFMFKPIPLMHRRSIPSSTTCIRDHRSAPVVAAISAPHTEICRRWPSWDSSLCASTAWGRPSARSHFTRHTTRTSAITRFPTR